jgi:hypothetical protein
MNAIQFRTVVLLLLTSLIVAGGCDRQAAGPQANGTEAADVIPQDLMLASAPAEASELKAIKGSARVGDEVVVRGVIGGRRDPLASNRAILTLVDVEIETCDKLPGDSCPTPWDACCVDQETITAGSATVQVVGSDGRPLKIGLQGHNGIQPLREIVVVGKVRGTDDKNLVIDAKGIYVKS